MNDRLPMEIYLLILKSTIEVYIHGTLESTNDSVREVLKNALEETLTSQKETYNIMKEHNWYDVSNVENTAIKQILNKLQQNN